MAQTDNTAIKGAAIGLVVMFALFVLGSWFLDRFTGRGLNAEEPILSIAVYAPSVPESQWGDASNGLKARVSFTRSDPSQFLENTLVIQYQNITDKDIAFLHDPNETLKSFSAVNRDKWKLKLNIPHKDVLTDIHKLTEDEFEKMYTPSVQVIHPDEIFKAEIICVINNDVNDMGFIDGFFDVSYVMNIDKKDVSEYQSDSSPQIWTGKVKAGECKIFLTMPHDGGCNDCHGDADYHHGMLGEERYCVFCHAVGNAVLNDTCIRCHKRDEHEEYGRRRVLGPDGDFDNASKHISGIIKDADCLVCHNMEKHGYGTVYLNDPNAPGTRTFTDEYTEFCLACHNSNPPEGVKFPEKAVKVEKKTDSFDSPFSGFGAFSDEDSLSEDENDYSDSNDSFGFGSMGSMGSMWGGTAVNSEKKTDAEPKTSIYDKSDFVNSELHKKNVNCTDCHRSHGSDRPSLLKNVHGPDDKVRI